MPATEIMLLPGEEMNEHQYQRHDLGTKARTKDGRTYRYAEMGATVGVAGNLYQGALPIANHLATVVDVVRAVGAVQVSSTLGGTAATVDYYAEGYAHVNKVNGLGSLYPIQRAYKADDGHAKVSSGAILTANITTPVKVALVATSELTYTPNRFRAVIIDPSPATAALAGIAPHAVTAAYFFWAQTGGRACVYTIGTVVIGDLVVNAASTSGGVMPSAAIETDGPIVGICASVNVTGEYSAIDLLLDS